MPRPPEPSRWSGRMRRVHAAGRGRNRAHVGRIRGRRLRGRRSRSSGVGWRGPAKCRRLVCRCGHRGRGLPCCSGGCPPGKFAAHLGSLRRSLPGQLRRVRPPCWRVCRIGSASGSPGKAGGATIHGMNNAASSPTGAIRPSVIIKHHPRLAKQVQSLRRPRKRAVWVPSESIRLPRRRRRTPLALALLPLVAGASPEGDQW